MEGSCSFFHSHSASRIPLRSTIILNCNNILVICCIVLLFSLEFNLCWINLRIHMENWWDLCSLFSLLGNRISVISFPVLEFNWTVFYLEVIFFICNCSDYSKGASKIFVCISFCVGFEFDHLTVLKTSFFFKELNSLWTTLVHNFASGPACFQFKQMLRVQ